VSVAHWSQSELVPSLQTEPLISKAKHILKGKSRSVVHSRVGLGVGLPAAGLPGVGEGVIGRGVGSRVGLDVGILVGSSVGDLEGSIVGLKVPVQVPTMVQLCLQRLLVDEPGSKP